MRLIYHLKYCIIKTNKIERRKRMQDLEKVYKELTNVDLQTEKRVWDERGKGYYGEFLVFRELFKCESENSKFLMNLCVPTASGKKTEIDLVMVNEKGIFVFEVKYYKGTIYGKSSDKIWTQYFRTKRNNTFQNPMLQNEYHIQAIKRLFPDIPIFSTVVFAGDAEIKVLNYTDVLISNLYDLRGRMNKLSAEREEVLDIEKIEKVFCDLEVYAPKKDNQIPLVNGGEVPINEFLYLIREELITELENEKKAKKTAIENIILQKRKEKEKQSIIFIIIIAALAVLCLLLAVSNFKMSNEEEKNKYVDSHVSISNQSSEGSVENLSAQDILDDIVVNPIFQKDFSSPVSISFSAQLTNTSEKYEIALTPESKFIFVAKNGKEIKYSIFGERLKYDAKVNRLGTKGSVNSIGTLLKIKTPEIKEKEDVKKISITNVDIYVKNGFNPILTNNTVLLYEEK